MRWLHAVELCGLDEVVRAQRDVHDLFAVLVGETEDEGCGSIFIRNPAVEHRGNDIPFVALRGQ